MSLLEMEGEMTIYTAAEQKSQLLAFLEADDGLEINLAKVSELDTAGLQLLIMAKREAAQHGKTLQFTMHSPVVLSVLELANLTTVFGDQVVLTDQD